MSTKGAAAAYPSAARISDSPCYLQYSASLKCLEEFGSDKSKCQDHFDVYKECKKKEVVVVNEYLGFWRFQLLCCFTYVLFCFSEGSSTGTQ
ncbi:Cox19 family protein (CHCH motif) [Arabidopsis thaliana]|uniref:Cox19 family protein (CHCH motif) n=1 Tax=Arabidopsis thaliana TaxID=3702 RepID=A8MQS6_ARATH|nr:Cox19 family protein (CHCH motif) [Arabidopsis thaliana]AEE27395.1 Cox19 family protein (CHCH motif) [Arabidopsis thaliana]|eukprot:NP_001077449.1 Cox19 family protein (CHCH motif) [Arabidopsis thaliana]